jgi:hypothetical protein
MEFEPKAALFEAEWSMWNLVTHMCISCGLPRHHEESLTDSSDHLNQSVILKPNASPTPHYYYTVLYIPIPEVDKRVCHFCSCNVVENGFELIQAYFVMECPLYSFIENKVVSLFQKFSSFASSWIIKLILASTSGWHFTTLRK